MQTFVLPSGCIELNVFLLLHPNFLARVVVSLVCEGCHPMHCNAWSCWFHVCTSTNITDPSSSWICFPTPYCCSQTHSTWTFFSGRQCVKSTLLRSQFKICQCRLIQFFSLTKHFVAVVLFVTLPLVLICIQHVNRIKSVMYAIHFKYTICAPMMMMMIGDGRKQHTYLFECCVIVIWARHSIKVRWCTRSGGIRQAARIWILFPKGGRRERTDWNRKYQCEVSKSSSLGSMRMIELDTK